MSLSTTTPGLSPEEKKANLKKLREYHQPMLDALGIPDAYFVGKVHFKPHGKLELFISFFVSELNRGEDLYVEFSSKHNISEDPDRKLRKWKFNPHFAEEYERVDATAPGSVRYLIPIEELVIMELPELEKRIQTKMAFDVAIPNDDAPMSEMTILDYAAIHLKKPVSKKEWLNKIVKK